MIAARGDRDDIDHARDRYRRPPRCRGAVADLPGCVLAPRHHRGVVHQGKPAARRPRSPAPESQSAGAPCDSESRRRRVGRQSSRRRAVRSCSNPRPGVCRRPSTRANDWRRRRQRQCRPHRAPAPARGARWSCRRRAVRWRCHPRSTPCLHPRAGKRVGSPPHQAIAVDLPRPSCHVLPSAMTKATGGQAERTMCLHVMRRTDQWTIFEIETTRSFSSTQNANAPAGSTVLRPCETRFS